MELYLMELGFKSFPAEKLDNGESYPRMRLAYSFGGGNWLKIQIIKKGSKWELQRVGSSGPFGTIVYEEFLKEKDFNSVIHFIKSIGNNKELLRLKEIHKF